MQVIDRKYINHDICGTGKQKILWGSEKTIREKTNEKEEKKEEKKKGRRMTMIVN